MLTIDEIEELEFGLVRSLQGGRVEYMQDDIIRWNPYLHGIVGLYNGNMWVPIMPAENIYFENSQYDINGSLLEPSTNYDVFARFYDYETFTLELSPWSSDTVRAVEPSRFEGVLVYDNTTVSGKQMRYIATVRMDGSVNFADSLTQRFVVNWDNPIYKSLHSYNSSSASWNTGYGDTTWAEFRDGTSQVRGEFLSIHPSVGGYLGRAQTYVDGGSHWPWVGLGCNSTSSPSGGKGSCHRAYDTNLKSISCMSYFVPVIGYNYITIVVRAQSSFDASCYGASDLTRAVAQILV